MWQLLQGVLGVPLAAPDDELLSLGAVDTVAGSQHHLLGKERGSTQIDVNLLVLSQEEILETAMSRSFSLTLTSSTTSFFSTAQTWGHSPKLASPSAGF